MSRMTIRWARSLSIVLGALTLGTVALLVLAAVGIARSSGRDDELGVALAVGAAALATVGLAASAPLWWLTSSAQRRARDGQTDRLAWAAALSLTLGIGTVLVPSVLVEVVGSAAVVVVPFLLAGVALSLTSAGVLRSLHRV